MPEQKIDIKIEKIDKKKDEKKNALPSFMESVPLTFEQTERLKEEFKKQMGIFEEERREKDYVGTIERDRRQYDGVMPASFDLEFKVHKHTTKKICDVVIRHVNQAYLTPNPKVAVNPRPEFHRQEGTEVTEDIEDYLDYQMDERMMDFPQTFAKFVKDATTIPVAVLACPYTYKTISRKRREWYKGAPITEVNPETGEETVTQNEGLESFLNNYPTAELAKISEREYVKIIKDLQYGKEVFINAEYQQVLKDNPDPRYVDPINFFCSLSVDNYYDLCLEKLKGELREFTWWQLKGMEKDGIMLNVDRLKYQTDEKTKNKVEINDYQYKKYQIYFMDYWFKMKEDDKDGEETRILFWQDKETEINLGAIYYPYFSIDSIWIPGWIDNQTQGFMKKPLTEFMTDSNMAQDILLNLMLQSYYVRSILTPISREDSPTHRQFLENRWAWGLNIDTDGQPIDFAQKYLPHVDADGMIKLLQYLVMGDEDATGVMGIMTGRESPTDPRAPAAKLLALLEKSGISVKSYIEALAPAFNVFCNIIMQLDYQMSEDDGRDFALRQSRVTGEEVFKKLKRQDMVAKVNFQTQATLFNFEKKQEKQEDLAFLQIMRGEPLVANNPDAIWTILRNIASTYSPKWRRLKDKILPTLDKLQQEKLKVGMQAVEQYAMAKRQQAEQTGQVDVNQDELMAFIDKQISRIVTPPSEEEIKAEEEAQKQAQKEGAV